MKRKILITLLGSLFLCTVEAQNYKVEYTYDAAGNRTSRMVIPIPPQGSYSAKKQMEPLKQLWGERKILVYPNPTKGALKIAITNGTPGTEYKAKVYDQNGRIFCTEQRKGDGDLVIDLSAQASGMFILVLSTGTEEMTYKIVKE